MIAEDKEIILLKVSGQDKPGVTAGLTSILANYDAILDIGQADIHDTLSLGILFEIHRVPLQDLF
jgi:phosphoserine phosphatase